MEKKAISRSYQENLVVNLIEQFNEMEASPDQVVVAKKMLVSVRYFITNFTMDEDIVDELSSLVDKVMEKLTMGSAIPNYAQASVCTNQ